MARFNTNGNNTDNEVGRTALIVIIILAISVVGLAIWIIYKIIQAIVRAVQNKKRQQQNAPVIV